ncbi:MAG: phosphate transporter permease [Betaproteobacteria bacterium HGW-Betaproteobacteria-14]|nr:MAG: phosphate transporter permease [Betaproteobacteria bacterium HGW-Betaproteobacteria-14]
MRAEALNPLAIAADLARHRALLGQLVKRDVLLRYRGALFGVLWIFLSPLLMLAIFAFVFGHIFQSRWPNQPDGLPFWLMLYAGLIVFNVFGETVSRAPTAVRGHASYVKKIIFPVGILPLVPLGAALVHAAFNFLILTAALAWTGHLSPGILLFPLLLLPAVLLGIGAAWFLAAWGVFIKDMTQIVPLFVQMLLFLSPVFYPVSAVPPGLTFIYHANPLGAVIEAARAAMIGQPVPWIAWAAALALGAAAVLLGHAFFQHSRDEFADAL